MKAAILNGINDDDLESQKIYDLVTAELVRRNWQLSWFALRELQITHCRGCFQCWTKRPGICKFNDEGQHIARAFIASDVVVAVTPVTFGGYSAELKKALDRIICLILPFFTTIDGEVHHQKRYERYPRLLIIGILPAADPESEKIFRTLVQRNALNLHTKSFSKVIYLNDKRHPHQQVIHNLLTNLEVTS